MGTTTVTTVDRQVKPGGAGVGGEGGGGPSDPGGLPAGGSGASPEDAFQTDKYRIGMWVALAGIVMLFAALTSAYIVRQTQGLSEDFEWRATELPSLLWVNTTVLLASSITYEMARRSLTRAGFGGFNRWMSLTSLLGIGFLTGQVITWRQLVARGVYLSTTPHSSFFYLLTSVHGLHLLCGVIAVSYVTVRGWRYDFGPARRTAVDVTALYWHFMDGLWIFLFLLLFFWR